MKDSTKIIHTRNSKRHIKTVNPSIEYGSTLCFNSIEELDEASNIGNPGRAVYGRYGTNTQFTLMDMINELENSHGTILTSSGMAAITTSLLSILKEGDEVLIIDACYSPTKEFANSFLNKFGITAKYYPSHIASNIDSYISNNTKVIFLESPASITYEITDLEPIVKIAQERGIVTMMDNSYSTPLNFKPLNHGIDISIQSATKYLSGHADVMMGTIATHEKLYSQLFSTFKHLGHSTSPMDSYLLQRGIRTLDARMEIHYQNAIRIIEFFEEMQKEFENTILDVIAPRSSTYQYKTLWNKYFSRSNGLITIILNFNLNYKDWVNQLKLFKIGYSWGGFESVILPTKEHKTLEDSKKYISGRMIRLHIGMENIDDILEDLHSIKKFV